MGSIIPLHEGDSTGERKPCASVIKACEELLEMAKTGEVVGVIYAITYYDKAAGYAFSGVLCNSTVGALESAKLHALSSGQ